MIRGWGGVGVIRDGVGRSDKGWVGRSDKGMGWGRKRLVS